MRISDWSSDVCSSDLLAAQQVGQQRANAVGRGHLLQRAAERLLGKCQVALLQVREAQRVADLRVVGGVVGRLRQQHQGGIRVAALQRYAAFEQARPRRSEEHTSELQSLMRISYAVFCLKKKKKTKEP